MEKIYADFSAWIPWDIQRPSDFGVYESLFNSPGVYAITFIEAGAAGKPRRINASSDLVYVGESCEQTLAKRLRQFARSAAQGKLAHSGGSKYFKHRRKLNSTKLFVAVISLEKLKGKKRKHESYVRLAERLVIWKHFEKHGSLPLLNSK